MGLGVGAGANVLLRYACDNPEKVAGLILANPRADQAGEAIGSFFFPPEASFILYFFLSRVCFFLFYFGNSLSLSESIETPSQNSALTTPSYPMKPDCRRFSFFILFCPDEPPPTKIMITIK